MNFDTYLDALLSLQHLAHTSMILLSCWIGVYFGQRLERSQERAVPWRWTRQPSGWKLSRGSSGRYLPEPPPMPQIGGLMSDLDQAAVALSLYVWSPDQVETALLIAHHHLDRVQAELDRVEEIQCKANELKEKK